MPTTLTDSNAFTSPVVVPAGSDARTAASVDTPFQTLANRTYYLQQLAEVDGVKRLRTVDTLAALAAIAPGSRAQGDAVFVTGSAAGVPLGIYYFFSSSAVAVPTVSPLSNLIVAPSSGGGQWWNASLAGFVTGTGDAKRWAVPVANAIGLTAYTSDNAASPTTIAAGVFTQVPSQTLSLALKAGDYVNLDARGSYDSNGANVNVGAYIGIVSGPPSISNAIIGESKCWVNGSGINTTCPMSGQYHVIDDGTFVFGLYYKEFSAVSGSGTSHAVNPFMLRATVIRPLRGRAAGHDLASGDGGVGLDPIAPVVVLDSRVAELRNRPDRVHRASAVKVPPRRLRERNARPGVLAVAVLAGEPAVARAGGRTSRSRTAPGRRCPARTGRAARPRRPAKARRASAPDARAHASRPGRDGPASAAPCRSAATRPGRMRAEAVGVTAPVLPARLRTGHAVDADARHLPTRLADERAAPTASCRRASRSRAAPLG